MSTVPETPSSNVPFLRITSLR